MNLWTYWKIRRLAYFRAGAIFQSLAALIVLCQSCGLPSASVIPPTPSFSQIDSYQYNLTFTYAEDYFTKGVYIYYKLINTNDSSAISTLETLADTWAGIGSSIPASFAASNNCYYMGVVSEGKTGTETFSDAVPTIRFGSGEYEFTDTPNSYSFTLAYDSTSHSFTVKDDSSQKTLEGLRGFDTSNTLELTSRMFLPELLDNQLKKYDLVNESSSSDSWYLMLIAVSYYMDDNGDNLENVYSVPAVISAAIPLE